MVNIFGTCSRSTIVIIIHKIIVDHYSLLFQVYAEELKGGNEIVHMTFRSTNLDNKVPQK